LRGTVVATRPAPVPSTNLRLEILAIGKSLRVCFWRRFYRFLAVEINAPECATEPPAVGAKAASSRRSAAKRISLFQNTQIDLRLCVPSAGSPWLVSKCAFWQLMNHLSATERCSRQRVLTQRAKSLTALPQSVPESREPDTGGDEDRAEPRLDQCPSALWAPPSYPCRLRLQAQTIDSA